MIREFSLHWGCLHKKVSVHGAQMETDGTLAVWTNSFCKLVITPFLVVRRCPQTNALRGASLSSYCNFCLFVKMSFLFISVNCMMEEPMIHFTYGHELTVMSMEQ